MTSLIQLSESPGENFSVGQALAQRAFVSQPTENSPWNQRIKLRVGGNHDNEYLRRWPHRLLIVDPYNDFMSEGGKLYDATRETTEAVGFYDNMRKLIPSIRAARMQVFIVPHHRWREDDYKGWKRMNPTQVRANQIHGFAAGSWGGEFHPGFGPRDGDVVVLEHWAQSGFANTTSTPSSDSGGSRTSSSSAS
jgi:hypothetical protein